MRSVQRRDELAHERVLVLEAALAVGHPPDHGAERRSHGRHEGRGRAAAGRRRPRAERADEVAHARRRERRLVRLGSMYSMIRFAGHEGLDGREAEPLDHEADLLALVDEKQALLRR